MLVGDFGVEGMAVLEGAEPPVLDGSRDGDEAVLLGRTTTLVGTCEDPAETDVF